MSTRVARALLWCSRAVPAGTPKIDLRPNMVGSPPRMAGVTRRLVPSEAPTAGVTRGSSELRSIHPCPPCYPSRALLWWLASASPRRLVVNPVRAGRQQRQRRCRVPEPELVRAASIKRAREPQHASALEKVRERSDLAPEAPRTYGNGHAGLGSCRVHS